MNVRLVNGCVFALVLLLGCGKIPTPVPNEEFEHFVGNFELGNLNGFYFLVNDTSVNTSIITAPVRNGNFSLKNQLRPTDYVFNGYRSELAIYNCAKYNTEVFYGFSFLIDTSYQNTEFNIIAQWQDLPNYMQGEVWDPMPILHGSAPPLYFVYINDVIKLVMNDNTSSNDQTFVVAERVINKGQWHDLVCRVYWSDDNTAFVEAWLDTTTLTPFNGTDNKYYQRNLFNRAGNYFKFGQYTGGIPPDRTLTILFDEVRIGTSYAEVAP